MLERFKNVSLTLFRLLDIAVVAWAFYLAYELRTVLPQQLPILGHIKPFSTDPVAAVETWKALLIILISWWMLLRYTGAYSRAAKVRVSAVVISLIKTNLLGIVLLGAAAFIFRFSTVSRLLILIFVFMNFFMLLIEKWIVYFLVDRLALSREAVINLVLVGDGDRAQNFIHRVAAHPEEGVNVIGLVSWDRSLVGTQIYGLPIIESAVNLDKILAEHAVDEVVVVNIGQNLDKLQVIAVLCEEVGVRISLVADLLNLSISKTVFRHMAGIPLLSYTTTPIDEWGLFFKRMLDIVASATMMVALFPVFSIVAVAIKVTSPGPVVFGQTRSGQSGRLFKLYKFRSMVVDAEDKLAELTDLNEMDGPVFKIRRDPRITKVGRFIRRTSIDELPQLYNVLKGEMSLVGPRPPLPEEVEKYERWQRRRLSVRPGITCIWQVSGRNQIDFDEWMRLDLQYIDNWSLSLDIKILVRTFAAVLTAKGAS